VGEGLLTLVAHGRFIRRWWKNRDFNEGGIKMEYSTPARITLEITSPTQIKILDVNNQEITDDVPIDQIKALYQRPGGVRHFGEILFDDHPTNVPETSTGCYVYVHLNCKWVKVPAPCP
jgi:hypothetical protein